MLSFIDVSGDPFSSPEKSSWIVAAAVCLKKDCLDTVNQTMHRLKRDILGNERIELKATDLVNPSTLNNPKLNKAEYLERLILECVLQSSCYCAAVVFQNTGKNQKSTNEILPKHYRDLLWRIELICRRSYVTDSVIILDNDARKVDRNLAFAFTNYMYRNSSGAILKHIVSVPIFADSETTAGLQLADIIAGILRKYYDPKYANNDGSTFWQKIQEYTKIILDHSVEGKIERYNLNSIYIPKSPYSLN